MEEIICIATSWSTWKSVNELCAAAEVDATIADWSVGCEGGPAVGMTPPRVFVGGPDSFEPGVDDATWGTFGESILIEPVIPSAALSICGTLFAATGGCDWMSCPVSIGASRSTGVELSTVCAVRRFGARPRRFLVGGSVVSMG